MYKPGWSPGYYTRNEPDCGSPPSSPAAARGTELCPGHPAPDLPPLQPLLSGGVLWDHLIPGLQPAAATATTDHTHCTASVTVCGGGEGGREGGEGMSVGGREGDEGGVGKGEGGRVVKEGMSRRKGGRGTVEEGGGGWR